MRQKSQNSILNIKNTTSTIRSYKTILFRGYATYIVTLYGMSKTRISMIKMCSITPEFVGFVGLWGVFLFNFRPWLPGG